MISISYENQEKKLKTTEMRLGLIFTLRDIYIYNIYTNSNLISKFSSSK